MDADELAEYRAGTVAGCRDCTATYADEMRAEGRCNGVPGELLAGVVPDEEDTPMPEPITLAGKRHAVTVTVPCGTCAHAEVCRIRPSIEGVRSLTVIAPDADTAVSFAVSAVVSCGHWAKGKARPVAVGGEPVPAAPRKMNLTDEDRERRRQQALAMSAARRAASEAAAS